MISLHKFLMEQKEGQTIVTALRQGLKNQLISGLTGTARHLFMAGIIDTYRKPVLIVTHSLLQANKISEDLSNILPHLSVALFPVNDMIVAEMSTASPEMLTQRLQVINNCLNNACEIVIVPLAGIKKILPRREIWEQSQLSVTVGHTLNVPILRRKLHAMGYIRNNIVAGAGEYSIRGGIIDIYPITEDNPIRIELFDDEVDSVRTFSVADQRSLMNLKQASVGPATEVIVDEADLQQLSAVLEHSYSQTISKMKKNSMTDRLIEFAKLECQRLRSGEIPEYIARYIELLSGYDASILDYMPADTLLLFDDFHKIEELDKQLQTDEANYRLTLLESGVFVPEVGLTHDFTNVGLDNHYLKVYLSNFLQKQTPFSLDNVVNFLHGEIPQFFEQWELLKKELHRWLKDNYTVILLANSSERIPKIIEMLEHLDFSNILTVTDKIYQGKLQVASGVLATGLEISSQKLVVITERELFREQRKKRFRSKNATNAERIKSYAELNIGDYVVHVNHGIGKYIGIETLLVDNVHKDFLHLKYAGDDKLYVPVEQIEYIQKYVGASENKPKLYKLGNSEWKKVKAKVTQSVEAIADELMELYVAREVEKGHAFSTDNELQSQFEAEFPYVETEDQLRTITEVKRDMEKERPMDRLLCGDVGFGKTEVALRAAFKAVMDHKQVAFLVPTTILAQQHYETLCGRLKEYPINVGLLSRFRTAKQQKETLLGLRRGTIDIVVGTHRLLSKDVVFSDIGLLIVDEEQRFGVKHKERIKQLKTNIDVLTLTATPIPRTLHLSILGVRDLSVIETPPLNRFPIQTYVVEYQSRLVKSVIERELVRGGQVFFLHNYVSDIERQASFLAELVPEARVMYAHGQMNERQLEDAIYQFINHEYDVLVSTTIIETGIDVPTVNTLIVNHADRMGLAQLYQLRGRVGRSDKIAYAYFTYQPNKELTEVAEKRLQSIKEFTQLGSGFKIAMRDLTIRGAGNILGASQHGFIDDVGYDMYAHLLSTAVNKRKNKEKKIMPKKKMLIDGAFEAYIPIEYIATSNQKVEMYQAVRSIETASDLIQVKDEFIDRFGDYPKEVTVLLQLAELKILGSKYGIESIQQVKSKYLVMKLSKETTANIDGYLLLKHLHKLQINANLKENEGKIYFTFNKGNNSFEHLLAEIIVFVKKFSDYYK